MNDKAETQNFFRGIQKESELIMNDKDETQNFTMPVDLLQPWSTFVMKTVLPPVILKKMLNLTDRIYENKTKTEIWNQPSISHGSKLIGEIENEFTITEGGYFHDSTGSEQQLIDVVPPEILADKSLMAFFEEVTKSFICQCYLQNDVSVPLTNEEKKTRTNMGNWLIDINSMWSVHQKDNEYNPIHSHAQCDVSAVMYLKIPEYLPSRKTEQNPESAERDFDGTINFTNVTGTSHRWGQPTMTIHPQVGDFFIFPATQQHLVYPFRTPDGKGERRSVSFNARFISIDEIENTRILKNHRQKEVKDE